MWLPPDFPRQVLVKKLETFGKVVNVFEEHMQEEEFKHIKNGILRIKMCFKNEEMKRADDIPGVKWLLDTKILITRLGFKLGCFHCKETDHVKRDCPKMKLICQNCGKRGHEKNECSLAKRLTTVMIDDEEEDNEIPFVTENISGNLEQRTSKLVSNDFQSETVFPCLNTVVSVIKESTTGTDTNEKVEHKQQLQEDEKQKLQETHKQQSKLQQSSSTPRPDHKRTANNVSLDSINNDPKKINDELDLSRSYQNYSD